MLRVVSSQEGKQKHTVQFLTLPPSPIPFLMPHQEVNFSSPSLTGEKGIEDVNLNKNYRRY